MKTTRYFDHMKTREDRESILLEWIERVIATPEARERQSDGRIRLWKRILEAEGRWLRVVLLEDEETVHNAFFDRRFKETRE